MRDPAPDPAARAVAALAALGHGARLALFRHIPDTLGAAPTTRALADAFGLDVEGVNQHLTPLRRAGLVRAERHQGQVVHVREPGCVAWLSDHLEPASVRDHENARAVAGAGGPFVQSCARSGEGAEV
jgi:DNA-binding transcriptional ArsR family regulator